MATYTVTTLNWNSPAFWANISETAPGHTLDFSALGTNFSITVDTFAGIIAISDGVTSFTVGEAGITGTDATFGGATQLDYFTSILGAQGADTIVGTLGDDVLDGNAGNDYLEGLDGHDTFYGNGGADTLVGNSGNDLVYGGAGNDSISGLEGADRLFGETGDDTILAGSEADSVYGGAGADLIWGGDGDDQLEGGWEDAAADTILGDAGNDLIFGYGGGDSLLGGTGNDFIDGGAGADFIDGGTDQDRIVGDLGNDTILGGAGYDILTGGEGADLIDGGDDADAIWGNAGDTIVGGEGGDDWDTLYVSNVDFITYSTAESGTVTFNSGQTLQFSQIESVVIQTPDGVVDGTAGDDQIGQFYYDAEGEWIDNGDAIGEGDGDSVRAGDGNDTVWAHEGDDTVYGEGGNDYIDLGGGNNVAFGGAGADTIDGGWLNDTISGDDFVATGPNLIVNGSFEDTTGMDPSPSWGFSGTGGIAPGWTDANGFAIEFHNDGRGGLLATDGANWLDLEANPGQNNFVRQTVSGVQDGQVYVLTFDAADLSDIDDGTTQDNQLQVIWNGEVVGTIDAVDGAWRSYEFHLIGGAGDGTNTLAFAGLGDASGIGASLDNVQMYATTEAVGDADSLTGWDGNDDLIGGAGNDTIDGGGGADMIVAGSGDDRLLGEWGNDTIWGGTGNDTIDAGAENDLVFGGDGNDSILGGAGDDIIDGGADNDTIDGGLGNDSLLGGSGDDFLTGGDGSDTLRGGLGQDTLIGGAGGDFLQGDEASDLADYSASDAAVTIVLNGGGDVGFAAGGHAENDTIVGIDELIGSDFNDSLTGYDATHHGSLSNVLDGGAGDDTIDGLGGNDILIGGSGNDSILGGSGDDTIFGGTENDTIDAGAENDIVWGGEGNDSILGGTGNDTLSGDTGADTIDGGDGADSLQGGQGGDSIAGGAGSDFILGDGQWYTVADYASTASAATNLTVINSADGPIQLWWINGSGGLDFYATIDPGITYVQPNFENHNWVLRDADGHYLELIEGAANQTVNYGAEGLNDSIDGGDGHDTIHGQFGDDTIDGGNGDDLIYGGTGNDSILGGSDDDTIYGGDGNDTINVGTGFDLAYGETGNDLLIDGTNGSEATTLYGGDGNDTILSGAGTASAFAEYYGDAGDDRFEDRGGTNQTFNGGADSDTYVVLNSLGNDTVIGGETITTGTDFDTIDLSALTTGVTVTYTGNEAGTITDGTSTITFSEIEQIILTDQADRLTGGIGNEVIDGRGGNDTIVTNSGDDTILGGAGNDSVLSGSGNDIVDGGDGNDVLYGGTGNDTLFGGEGVDNLSGQAGDDVVYGQVGSDQFYVETGNGNDTLIGGETNETGTGDVVFVTNTVNSNVILTGNEAGTITMGTQEIAFSEIERILLSTSDDTDDLMDATVATQGISFGAGLGDDTLIGGSGNDFLWGQDGNDSLSGGAGNDTIQADQGNDTMDGGLGNDRLLGGADADLFNFTDSFGSDTVIGGEAVTTGTDFDTIDLSALTTGVTVTYTGNEAGTITDATNTISFSEIEQILLSTRNDIVNASADISGVIVDGGAGDDSFTGGSGDDIFYGRSGSDYFYSSAGNDTFYGGDGWDYAFITGTLGNHHIDLGVENPVAANSNDWINFTFAETLDLIYTGSDGSVTNGTDTLTFNEVDGWTGTFNYGGTFDARALTAYGVGVDITGGWATLYGSQQDDIFSLNGSDDRWVDGGAGNDYIAGDAGNDSFDGGADNDILEGWGGNDTLTGGAGNDAMYGGADRDTFLLADGHGNDTIFGGETGDEWDVIDASAVTGNSAVTFTGNEAGTIATGADSATFSQIEEIRLGSGNDAVDASATTVGTTIDAGAGNDTLIGGTGNDSLMGGADADVFIVEDGFGNDTIIGGETVTTGADFDTIDLSALSTPVVVVFSGTNAGTITDFVTGDVITFSGIENLILTGHNDLVDARLDDGTTFIRGGEGNDTITGGSGGFNGGVYGDAGDDLIITGAGDDWIEGGDGNDTLMLGGGADVGQGHGGADTFVVAAGFGGTHIDGGTDYDLIDLNSLPNGVEVVFSGPNAGTITDRVTGEVMTFENISQLVLTDHDDIVDATLDDGATYIQMRDGNDIVQGSAGDDLYDDEAYGPDGQGNDTFIGGDGNDVIWAGTDDDSIMGGLGNDTLNGQSGDDIIDGGGGADNIFGGLGDDSVKGGAGDDLIQESSPVGTTVNNADTVTGTTANDSFIFAGDPGSSATIILDDGAGTATDGDIEFDAVFVTSTGDAASLTLEGFTYWVDRIQVSEPWTGLTSTGIASGHHQVTLTYANGNSQSFDIFHDNGSVFDPALAFFTYAGNDTLEGGDGNDTIDGAFGDDSITGGTGNDSVLGGSGDDTIGLGDNHGADTIFGGEDGDGADRDVLDLYENGTGQGATVLYTGNETGTVEFDGTPGVVSTFSEIEVMDGTNQADLIDASATTNGVEVYSNWGDDTVIGGAGADTVYAGLGADSISGGEGADFLSGQEGDDSIDAGAGNDTVDGGIGNDTVFGWTGDDSITGGDGDDLIFGQDGNDTISGGAGADRLDGDDGGTLILSIGGSDRNGISPEFEVRIDGVLVHTGTVTWAQDGSAPFDPALPGAFQNVVIALPAGAPGTVTVTFTNDFVPGDDAVPTEDRNLYLDSIRVGETLFEAETDATITNGGGISGNHINLWGTGSTATFATNDAVVGGADSIWGDEGNDTIIGDGGNDTLSGGEGDDLIFAGADDDSVSGGGGNDWLTGESGDDTVDGGDGADSVFGAEGNDLLFGGAGNDSMEGWFGNDTLDGGADNDYLDGGDGADVLFGGTGNDTLLGGNDESADYLDGGDGDDELSAGGGDDTLIGGAGADNLFAAEGDDILLGGDGNDTLQGWLGNDSFNGGAGDDLILGGDGNDTFSYAAGDGFDTIVDFNSGNTGTLDDGDSTNNDFIDLSAFYNNIAELQDDYADDQILNQSNSGNIVWGQAVDYSDNTRFDTDGLVGNEGIAFLGQSPDGTSFTFENTGVVCFTPGTLILTETGERPVESLRPGDRIVTCDNGVQTLQWLAQRTIGAEELRKNEKLRPVLIRPDRVGATAPLLVSPQHGVLLRPDGGDEMLVRAIHLARRPGGQARVANGVRQVTYIHLMFDAHQIVFANGAPSESFYPGPMALAALSDPVRDELRTVFPDLFTAPTEQVFGARARKLARMRDLPPTLRELRAA